MPQPTDLSDLLLLTAFRTSIKESDIAEGHLQFQAITGSAVPFAEFRDAVAALLAEGLIYDPVILLPGALQCHWRLEPTPEGVIAVQKLR